MSSIIVQTLERGGVRAVVTAKEYNGKTYHSVKFSKLYTKDGETKESSQFDKYADCDNIIYLILQLREALSPKKTNRPEHKPYAPKHTSSPRQITGDPDIDRELAEQLDLDAM